MAFAKLKTLLRKTTVRTRVELWRAGSNISDLSEPKGSWNYLKATGYVAD